MRGKRAAIIDRAMPRKADKITDAAGSGNAVAEGAVSDLALRDGLDRLLDHVTPKIVCGVQDATMVDLKTAVGHVIGLRSRQQIGMIALDAGLHQRLHDVRKADPLLLRCPGHFANDTLHMAIHVSLLQSRSPSQSPLPGLTPQSIIFERPFVKSDGCAGQARA